MGGYSVPEHIRAMKPNAPSRARHRGKPSELPTRHRIESRPQNPPFPFCVFGRFCYNPALADKAAAPERANTTWQSRGARPNLVPRNARS